MLEIPAWMFDRSACAKIRLAVDAHADLSALVALWSLLRDVLHDRPAESDGSDSIVSSLSRDPNRGDAHAMQKQAEAGAPSRAASNRFVRRGPQTIAQMFIWSALPPQLENVVSILAGLTAREARNYFRHAGYE
jgi:hypothetical protein